MSLNKNTVIKIANLSKIDIRDSEIEFFLQNLINEILVIKNEKINTIKPRILLNNEVNAFVTSGVDGPLPEQNNFKPPPEPVDSIIGVLNPLSCLPKVSATTVANG